MIYNNVVAQKFKIKTIFASKTQMLKECVRKLKGVSLLLLFVLSACTRHYESDEFDLNLANKAFAKLKLISVDHKFSIPKYEWPSYLKELGTERVFIDKTGIYIELDRFFVDESGLYSPFNINEDVSSVGEDPEFIYLALSLYSYHRKG